MPGRSPVALSPTSGPRGGGRPRLEVRQGRRRVQRTKPTETSKKGEEGFFYPGRLQSLLAHLPHVGAPEGEWNCPLHLPVRPELPEHRVRNHDETTEIVVACQEIDR